jgi:hypothetical protein
MSKQAGGIRGVLDGILSQDKQQPSPFPAAATAIAQLPMAIGQVVDNRDPPRPPGSRRGRPLGKAASPGVPKEKVTLWLHSPLRDALRTGLAHFFYEGNPLLGDLLWASPGHEFSMYASTRSTQGWVFYRNLRRGVIPNLPVVLVVNKEYRQIEKQISKDRDRNFFGDKLMGSFYNIFAKSQLRWDIQAMHSLLKRAEPCWNQGHPLIAEIARATCRSWDQATLDSLFHGKYFARSFAREAARLLEFDRLERQWQQKGLRPLPAYFASFGLPNAEQHLLALEQKVREENRRSPTPAETNSIEMLRETVREVKPEIMTVFDGGKTTYSVAESETVLGELRRDRCFYSREVFLAAEVFETDFARAFAVFVHEHAHIFGCDGSRGFTDALTELLETIIFHRKELDPYESRWLALRNQVTEERHHHAGRCEQPLEDRLDALTELELRAMLKNVPRVTLKRLFSAPP